MDSISSPTLLFTSDPASHDWEEDLTTIVLPSSTYSDEQEAIRLVQKETAIRKSKNGDVIQHRAWKLGDTFRSEADYPEGKLCGVYFSQLFNRIIQKHLCARDRKSDINYPLRHHPLQVSRCLQPPLQLHTRKAPLLLLPNDLIILKMLLPGSQR